MRNSTSNKLLWIACLLIAGVSLFSGVPAQAQVLDADCFSGNCGGQKGIPECPDGFDEVGFVLYANSKANAANDCETVVSCTNLGSKAIDLSCRFYNGFNPIRPGGPKEALCSTSTPNMAPGDTSECATDATPDPAYQAAGIFLGADGDCPTFEGKGLVCAKGGDTSQVFCEAHLACGNGTVLESIGMVQSKKSKNSKKER
jgi:hypothetical protein